jgi:hypothetical protein
MTFTRTFLDMGYPEPRQVISVSVKEGGVSGSP